MYQNVCTPFMLVLASSFSVISKKQTQPEHFKFHPMHLVHGVVDMYSMDYLLLQYVGALCKESKHSVENIERINLT